MQTKMQTNTQKNIKKAKQPLAIIAFSALLASTGPLYAAEGHKHSHDHADNESGMKHEHGSEHGHGDHKGHDHHGSAMNKMFLIKKEIDGYEVSFHVMKAKPGKEMGGSHDFMVKIEKDGKVLTDVVMNTKVKHPNGSSETKKAKQMGDWLMAGYDLGHNGKHQLMILFKTADGKKHKGGVYYPGR
ncbi:MAG: hypothetical protein GXP08_02470 [Gammaproteobacteria bacterium]|nr:hypothetical protein [Gammaproteobacteria bacterium]